MEFLKELVEHRNRMAGQNGETAGAMTVVDWLEEIDGIEDVHTDEFQIPGWWRGDSALQVTSPFGHEQTFDKSHEIIALPGTPAGTTDTSVVDVGPGTPADFEKADLQGAIALVSDQTPEDHGRRIHRMEKYANAVEAGAEGFIFRNYMPGNLPRTGEIGYHSRPGPIPAVSVSAEVGARLVRYYEKGDLDAEMTVDCRNESTTSRNVEARIGSELDGDILVTAHLDSHDIAEGACDNGAGSAIAIEVGRLLSIITDELDSGIRVVIFGSEEIGLYGAYHYAKSSNLDNIQAVLNIDAAGKSRNINVQTSGFNELGKVFSEVAEELDIQCEIDDTISPHGDQWAFVEKGIPGVMASSLVDEEGRGWGHTHADALEKIDPRNLRVQSLVIAEAAARLAAGDSDISHYPSEEIRDSIDAAYERELRVGGRWPYDD
jgi:aminopeptidase YwaD